MHVCLLNQNKKGIPKVICPTLEIFNLFVFPENAADSIKCLRMGPAVEKYMFNSLLEPYLFETPTSPYAWNLLDIERWSLS